MEKSAHEGGSFQHTPTHPQTTIMSSASASSSSSSVVSLTNVTVAVLKARCAKAGLDKSGKKADLVARLEAYAAGNNKTTPNDKKRKSCKEEETIAVESRANVTDVDLDKKEPDAPKVEVTAEAEAEVKHVSKKANVNEAASTSSSFAFASPFSFAPASASTAPSSWSLLAVGPISSELAAPEEVRVSPARMSSAPLPATTTESTATAPVITLQAVPLDPRDNRPQIIVRRLRADYLTEEWLNKDTNWHCAGCGERGDLRQNTKTIYFLNCHCAHCKEKYYHSNRCANDNGTWKAKNAVNAPHRLDHVRSGNMVDPAFIPIWDVNGTTKHIYFDTLPADHPDNDPTNKAETQGTGSKVMPEEEKDKGSVDAHQHPRGGGSDGCCPKGGVMAHQWTHPRFKYVMCVMCMSELDAGDFNVCNACAHGSPFNKGGPEAYARKHNIRIGF